VKRGDYEVIRPYDGQIICPSEFASTVQPGMVLEISIILRRHEAFQDIKETCPRCCLIMGNATVANGWIDCTKCGGQFLIAEADSQIGHGVDDGWDVIQIHRESDGEYGRKHGGKRSALIDGESKGNTAGVIDEEIISPQCTQYYKHPLSRDSLTLHQGNSDGAQFFRRIHVICNKT